MVFVLGLKKKPLLPLITAMPTIHLSLEREIGRIVLSCIKVSLNLLGGE
jgi:hypothetical protein